MKAKIYYQDFKLNGFSFDNDNLIFKEDKSVFIVEMEITDEEVLTALNKFLSKSITKTDNITRTDVANMIWRKMNSIFIDNKDIVVDDPQVFERIGHTSMSIGDYIKFDDGEIWIAGAIGWKVIRKNG